MHYVVMAVTAIRQGTTGVSVCLSVVPQIRLYRSLQCGADNGCKQHRRSAAMQSRVYSGDAGVYAMEDIWNATSKLGVIGVIAPDYR